MDNYVLGTKKIKLNLNKHHCCSNISKISAGNLHSLFQSIDKEIFGCGFNGYGECGLGHFTSPQITPSLLLNLPSNIVDFVCGSHQNLFLDSEGNVFSCGIILLAALVSVTIQIKIENGMY